MSNRITEANYTQIPNVIIDYWMHKLDSSSFKVLIFICRKTYGWHKRIDCLSLRKIMEGTHLSKSTVCKALSILEENELIIKTMHKNELGDQDPNTYEINVTEGVVQNLDHVVQNLDRGGSLNFRQGVVQNLDTQKKDLQNKEKEIAKAISKKKPENFEKIERSPDVWTSEKEHAELEAKLGKEKTQACYEFLSEWKQDKKEADPKIIGKHTDRYRITSWVVDKILEKASNSSSAASKEVKEWLESFDKKNVSRVKSIEPNQDFVIFRDQKSGRYEKIFYADSSARERIESEIRKGDFHPI